MLSAIGASIAKWIIKIVAVAAFIYGRMKFWNWKDRKKNAKQEEKLKNADQSPDPVKEKGDVLEDIADSYKL